MVNKDIFKLASFPDGAVCLDCGDGMERDLVFASGAMNGDPDLDEQRKILEFIMKAIKHYDYTTPVVTSYVKGELNGTDL